MHRLMRERLEELLSDALTPGLSREIASHLAVCPDCRRQVDGLREQCRVLKALRAPQDLAPAPGFYARVAERIESRREASFWHALLDPAFGWRLAAGSLAVLLVLAGLLAMNEAGRSLPPPAPPEAVMAIEEYPAELGVDPQRDRDAVLVTLATYHE